MEGRPGWARDAEAAVPAMLRGVWPEELLEDPARRPRYVATAEEFLSELLTGEHVEDFIILPNGTELLGLSYEDTIPEDVRLCMQDCRAAQDFVKKLLQNPEMLEKYRADVEYVDSKRQQRDTLRKDKLDLGKRIREALRMVEAGEVDAELLYVAEMRLKQEAPHPIGGEKVKTICQRDVKDVLGPLVSWTLYWDRYDEGFFAGGRFSGKGLHVDQVLWSNVGRNYKGYKLAAAWPKGECSKQVALEFYDVLFVPPLQPRELQALQKAAKVALLRPGDVYIFSGGVAHTVLCVSEEMCIGVYESFVTFHPDQVKHFLHTDDAEGEYSLGTYSMSPRSFRDTKDDCLDQLEDAADQLQQGGVAAVHLRTVPRAEAPPLWEQLRSRSMPLVQGCCEVPPSRALWSGTSVRR
ncbi:unnamed protein product [Symbiodinium sp. CCMP2456]|nr:unnamed protein product [Symbiodinium sp. CCMP2456]